MGVGRNGKKMCGIEEKGALFHPILHAFVQPFVCKLSFYLIHLYRWWAA